MICSKTCESAPPSVMKIEDCVYSALIWLKGVAVARDGIHDILQKLQRGFDVFMPVKWDKTPGEQLGHSLTGGQPGQHVPVSVLQNKNPLQRRAPRRRVHRLSVPGRAVHAHATLLAVVPSGETARKLFLIVIPRSAATRNLLRLLRSPQNNPIVAENLYVLALCPQPRRRALACLGVA